MESTQKSTISLESSFNIGTAEIFYPYQVALLGEKSHPQTILHVKVIKRQSSESHFELFIDTSLVLLHYM